MSVGCARPRWPVWSGYRRWFDRPTRRPTGLGADREPATLRFERARGSTCLSPADRRVRAQSRGSRPARRSIAIDDRQYASIARSRPECPGRAAGWADQRGPRSRAGRPGRCRTAGRRRGAGHSAWPVGATNRGDGAPDAHAGRAGQREKPARVRTQSDSSAVYARRSRPRSRSAAPAKEDESQSSTTTMKIWRACTSA